MKFLALFGTFCLSGDVLLWSGRKLKHMPKTPGRMYPCAEPALHPNEYVLAAVHRNQTQNHPPGPELSIAATLYDELYWHFLAANENE